MFARLTKNIALTTVLLVMVGCGSSSDDDDDIPPQPGDVTNFRFTLTPVSRWEAGFADYPVGGEEFYELDSGFGAVPEPVVNESGLMVTGANRSDDLFMFVTSEFGVLEPNQRYDLVFEIVFATDSPAGCVGIGGAPGESVYVKAGATTFRPEALDMGTGNLEMNISKGNQSTSGSDAITIGNVAVETDCGMPEFVVKTLRSEPGSFTLTTDATGQAWLLFGTDSGFEGTTTVYWLRGTLEATIIE